MGITRRQIILSSAMFGSFKAANVRAEEMKVPSSRLDSMDTVLPYTGMESVGGDYARFVLPGPAGLPTKSYRLNLIKGMNVLCWFPPNAKTVRPIIFSHGELSEPTAYRRLLQHWASHGFVVIAPVHDDSLIEEGLRTRRTTNGLLNWDINGVLNDPSEWTHRIQDCKKVLDYLPQLGATLGIDVNIDRPIIAGHSFGAFTAQILMGAQVKTSKGNLLNQKDERLTGAILMSPQGSGIMGLDKDSWKDVTGAILVVTGTGDNDATQQTFKQKEEPFYLSPPNYKHLAEFKKVMPTSYSGGNFALNTDEVNIFFDLSAISTAFLIAYGSYQQEVLNNLVGNYYHQATKGRVNIYYR